MTLSTVLPSNLTDVQTIIKNVSGSTLKFGFLPPHGKSLTNGSTFTLAGDIWSFWPRATQKRWRVAFQSAIDNGLIEVRRNVRNIFYGKVTNSGSVGTIAVGDLVYWDSVATSIRTATDFPSGGGSGGGSGSGNLALASFKLVFMGIALDAHATTAATVTNFRVDMSPNSVYEIPCTSQTHGIGDEFTLTTNSNSQIANSQLLVKTATANQVLARCVRYDVGATATAEVQLASAYVLTSAAAVV